ncbi:hypothetical protein EK21DRAFT_92684 [Setomelanomma holmii]|uniref:DUF6594 domain-containing protein n=1 Tax=Setomelanomma holmii TaxID=210430 RepID=A0A9P4H0H2_9PLEO|nr:hypothetical protein EK21DRAFT_92684 [Setomelanomma holmii]
MASATLPGPATAKGAQYPPSSTFIQMQPFPQPPQGSHSPVEEQIKLSMPWKYEGYQAISKWMASDDDFFVFRRFESLNADTILWMQDHIARLETELKAMHKLVADSKLEQNLRNDSHRWDEQHMPRRTQIMGELSRQLLHYNQFVDAFSKVRARPRAEKRQVDNVVNWLDRGAIVEEEADFANHASDLISINARTRTPLGRWLEGCRKPHLWRIFREKDRPGLHVKAASTVYSSNQKFDRLTSRTIIVLGLVMLLAPMWWLEFVSSSNIRLGIITGFLCVFISIMSTATINQPFQVVAATAAYAAVLMVFMQIDSNGSYAPT